MTPETLEALKGSIEKWRKIVEEGGVDEGWENCPLCALFFRNGCVDCPVSDATRMVSCDGSPYEEWNAQCHLTGRKADTPKKLAAARAELEFLRSLLPQEAES
jgi:hypothetical protein